MKKIITALLMSISLFAMAAKDNSNISIHKEKFEVVIQDGVETIFKTSTLKPVMIFEEVITIKNISNGHLKSVVYDFELDKQSVLFSDMDLGKDIVVLYSNNNGKSYSTFPIVEVNEINEENIDELHENKKPIAMEDYTNVRMTINKIMKDESKQIKLRYSYDHFAQ